ncbi:1-acyl-sn-glycerol-3-phosphate acyltransferase [Alphaproteobacteria bacterium]|nr:1-acyl-sn-glycerol-3-phosphate acyltransferase [Alphaproteobacteria bacterium]
MSWLTSILSAIVFYIGTSVLVILMLPVCLSARIAPLAGRLWGRFASFVAWISGISFRLEGNVPKGKQVIYAVKHQSAWETMVLFWVLYDPIIVMKQELMRIPFIGWVFKRTGSIGVDRSAGMAALKKLKRDALIALETGRPLLIFPQGTRVLPRTEAPYQIGVYALYSATGLPVVPVALNSGSFWPRKGVRKYPGCITLEFLPEIAPGLPRAAFMATLEMQIEQATARLEKGDSTQKD